jgi:hypothetical protein
VEPLGRRHIVRDFDHRVAEIQIRAAVLNGYTAFGIHGAEPKGKMRLGKEQVWASRCLCNEAA